MSSLVAVETKKKSREILYSRIFFRRGIWEAWSWSRGKKKFFFGTWRSILVKDDYKTKQIRIVDYLHRVTKALLQHKLTHFICIPCITSGSCGCGKGASFVGCRMCWRWELVSRDVNWVNWWRSRCLVVNCTMILARKQIRLAAAQGDGK